MRNDIKELNCFLEPYLLNNNINIFEFKELIKENRYYCFDIEKFISNSINDSESICQNHFIKKYCYDYFNFYKNLSFKKEDFVKKELEKYLINKNSSILKKYFDYHLSCYEDSNLLIRTVAQLI